MRDDLEHWHAWSITDGRHGPAGAHEMTFCWRGLARDHGDAMAAAKRAVETVWSIASGQPAAPPEGLFGRWSALPSDQHASEWVISNNAMAALSPKGDRPIEEREDALRQAMTLAVAILGIGALQRVPHGPVSAYVCLNHPQKLNWHTLTAMTQVRYKNIRHDPTAAEAMMALAIPSWLAAEGSHMRVFNECDYVPPDSATLRACEPEALRKPVSLQVAQAAEAIDGLGAPKIAKRLRALLSDTLGRTSA